MNAWRSRTVVAIAAGLIAGSAIAADDSRIVIGQTVALTGSISEHGQAVVTGARAYLESVNAAGGVGGRRISLVTLDDAGDATRAAENTRRLIDRDGVVAMFGGVEGGPCVASLKEASERGVPLIACMAGSPEMREPFNRHSFPVPRRTSRSSGGCSKSRRPMATARSRSCTPIRTPGASTWRMCSGWPTRASSR